MGTIEISSFEQLEVLVEQFDGEKSPVIDAALRAGGRLARDNMWRTLDNVVAGTFRRSNKRIEPTGELLESLGVSRPKTSTNRGDRNVKAGFREPRRKQPSPGTSKRGRAGIARTAGKRSYNVLTNAMLANILKHGVGGTKSDRQLGNVVRHTDLTETRMTRGIWQKSRDWLTPAHRNVEKHIVGIMEEAIEKKLKQLLNK